MAKIELDYNEKDGLMYSDIETENIEFQLPTVKSTTHI